MATVLITGGTGLIGRALSALLLDRGYSVIVLTRAVPVNKRVVVKGVRYATWNVVKKSIDLEAVQKADYMVHLAGAGVADRRWTGRRKEEIVKSRTQSSALLVKALKQIPNKVKAVISASGVGWYGADLLIPNPKPFIETDPASADFLGETCRAWERSIRPVIDTGQRLVILRTGIVLSNEGGALAEFKKPLRFGIAAVPGSGNQVVSWIHMDDICRMYLYAIENDDLSGVYNAVAPKPVNNKTLTLQLAKAVRGKFYLPLPVPSFVLRVVLGEMSIEILKSTTVSANKIRLAGFSFQYPSIESAIPIAPL